VDGAELRAIVREVVAGLLPSLMSGAGVPPPPAGLSSPRPAVAAQPTAAQPPADHPSAGQFTADHPPAGQFMAGQPPAGQFTVGQPPAGQPPAGQAGGARQSAPAQAGLAYTVREHAESVETVSLRTDADLAALVLRLLHLFENPKQRDALRSGRLRFRLAAPAGPGSVQPSHRIDKGAVTEAMVVSAAKAGARLVLGRRAVLTPLAKDRARAAGVEIERER
jgi:hypothetical protein